MGFNNIYCCGFLKAKATIMRKIYCILICIIITKMSTANTLTWASGLRTDSVAPIDKDVSSIDGIVAALYDVISGGAGEKRNWDRMRTLFIPEAKLMATGKRPDGSMAKRVRTLEEYITSSGPLLEKDGFFEREIGRTLDQYGSIVQLFSTYDSKRKQTDETPFARGINSIQLWNDGTRWWIVSILWQSESTDTPIPSKYLK